MTLAIAHKEQQSNRVVLDAVREWRPPFSPEAVIDECCELLRSYGIRRVTGDRYAGVWVREPFIRGGIGYTVSDLEKSRIYQAFLPLINSGRVELLDLPKLISQLASLERRTSRGGKDSIDHPKGSHDDVANAAAGALELASGRKRSQPPIIGVYGSYPTNETGPHRWDGLIEEGPFKGGYASSK